MKLFKFWKSILWFFLILYLTIFSGSSFNHVKLFTNADKLVHFGLFTGFSFLILLDLLKNSDNKPWYHFAFIAFIISTFLGASTELIQHFFITGRTGSFLDLSADIIGSVFGMILIKFYKKLFGLSF